MPDTPQIQSQISLVLQAIRARLEQLGELADWQQSPFSVVVLEPPTKKEGIQRQDDGLTWDKIIEMNTQAESGKFVFIVQDEGRTKMLDTLDGPVTQKTLHVDCYHRPLLSAGLIEPDLASECLARWLHGFKPIPTKSMAKKLKCTGWEQGPTPEGKFYVTKLTFSYELNLTAENPCY